VETTQFLASNNTYCVSVKCINTPEQYLSLGPFSVLFESLNRGDAKNMHNIKFNVYLFISACYKDSP